MAGCRVHQGLHYCSVYFYIKVFLIMEKRETMKRTDGDKVAKSLLWQSMCISPDNWRRRKGPVYSCE